MKDSEIKLYWKEQREATFRSSSTAPNLSAIPKHVDENYVEHQGSTPASEEAYRRRVVHCRCLPCPIYD